MAYHLFKVAEVVCSLYALEEASSWSPVGFFHVRYFPRNSFGPGQESHPTEMALIQTKSSLPVLNFNILTEVAPYAEHNVLLNMRATCTDALDLLTPLAFCALQV